jgi:hypothetical protein
VMSGSQHLVDCYVDDILNGLDVGKVDLVFSPSFRDFDPLQIPGVLTPSLPNAGTIQDVKSLVSILSQPGVDIRFTLEEIFEGARGQIAFRLFGEGVVPLADATDERTDPAPSDRRTVKKLAVRDTALDFGGLSPETGNLIADKLQVTYRCVGIFKAHNQQLLQRWGVIRVE